MQAQGSSEHSTLVDSPDGSQDFDLENGGSKAHANNSGARTSAQKQTNQHQQQILDKLQQLYSQLLDYLQHQQLRPPTVTPKRVYALAGIAVLVWLLSAVHNSRVRAAALKARRPLVPSSFGGPQGVAVGERQAVIPKERLLSSAAPARSFYDALRPELRYLTCDSWSGLTGEFLTALSLIHLAHLTHRVAIIPSWYDEGHYGDEVISMSDLFDMEKFRYATGALFVEWNDVKPLDRTGRWTKRDQISCYQGGFTYGLTFGHHNIEQQIIPEPLPRGWSFEAHVQFDLESWERIDATRKKADSRNETLAKHVMDEPGGGEYGLLCHSNLWDLRTVGGGMWVGPKGGMTDLLTMERRGIRPEWYKFGHYLDFVQPIWDIAEDCVRRTFYLQPEEPLPPFITVHIRRGDFLTWCPAGEHCVPSLSEYEPAVKSFLRDSPVGTKVLVATNEAEDTAFLDLIKKKGWYRIDHPKLDTHAKLAKQFGKRRVLWADAVVDQAILSMGRDFVGTQHSQVSWVSELRVWTWRGGRTALVARPGF